jgi:hypothetical protein
MWGVCIVVFIPLLRPLGLPIPVSENTLAYYNTVNALQPGDIVLYLQGNPAHSYVELGGGVDASIQHLMQLGVRLVIATQYQPECILVTTKFVVPILEAGGYVYGTDYVVFDLVAGGIVPIAYNMKDIVVTDLYGNSLYDYDTLPLMADIETTPGRAAEDFALTMPTGMENYREDWLWVFGVKSVQQAEGWTMTLSLADWKLGLYEGVIGGTLGCAEYEFLTGFPGKATAMVEGITVLMVYGMFLLIFPNIIWFIKKGRGGD